MSVAVVLLLLAQDVPLAAATVPDPELAQQRGGFTLPNGVDVALTVQTQTSVNGAVILQSVFRADQGAPTLSVYAPKAGETVAAAKAQGAIGVSAMPTVTYDSRSGILVTPGGGGPAVSITARGDAPSPAAGLTQIQPGTSLATDHGVVSQSAAGGLQTAELRAADLSVTHLAGTAFGSAIANSGSDRAIDTQTSLGIDLRNTGPEVFGSAMLRVEDVANGAMLARQ